MLAALLVLSLSVQGTGDERPAQSGSLDRTVALALAPDDPSGSRRVEHEVAFFGSLHVWTRSEIDLSVRVLDASGAVLAEDDGSGGGKTPYARLAVESGRDHLLAHVLRTDGAIARVELGAAAELEAEVDGWRRALGHPVGRTGARAGGRGTGVPAGAGEAERERGAALRARIVDPLLAAAGDVRTLYICPDDLVFLVPLDALPADEDGARVGDRLQIVVESSFGRLLDPSDPLRGEPSLVAFGGIDYGAAPAEGAASADDPASAEGALLAEVSAPIESAPRGAGDAGFASLPGAEAEASAVGAVFQRVFERDAFLASGARATKAELAERASGARYLHLATHGWFAPETVKSVLDERSDHGGLGGEGGTSWRPMRIEEAVTGFAPMTLCGLALAGANRGRDALGRVNGILTAEELCSLDLSQCELAVLSACETNVGIRRAGQGIQSLQAALHAAGARTAITSLWKVDDAATRELMERFYTYLWVEELPTAEALWKAKSDLRERGHPVCDWAAWVLSGDPG